MDNLEREVVTIFPVVHRVAGWVVPGAARVGGGWGQLAGDSNADG